MPHDAAPLMATIIVLFCLGYFTMASIPFLFVRLDIPEVWRLFRGLFNIYFRVVAIAGLVGAVAFASSGRLEVAAAMLLLAVVPTALRATVLERMDRTQTDRQSGDVLAMRRLRQIHWGAMLANTAILAAVAASVPFIV